MTYYNCFLSKEYLHDNHRASHTPHFGYAHYNMSDPENDSTSFHIIEWVETALNTSEISEMSFPDNPDNLTQNLINGFIALICILALIGNGRTIYLLAFSIKRNSYILNLSIADFGIFTSLIVAAMFVGVSTVHKRTYIVQPFFFFFFFFFSSFPSPISASQFLLTAISLDRSVAAFLPLWHHCHRRHISPLLFMWLLVCGPIWIFSFLLSAAHFILHQTRSSGNSPLLYQLIVNVLFCTPLMVLSTVTLWIHMRSKSQCKQRNLLTTILLALLFFLLFSLPRYASYVIYYFSFPHPVLLTIGRGSATLKSSINPLLYFLVGRKQRGKSQPRTSLKVALQIVFKDEQQDSLEEQQVAKEELS
ncbi:proto-oncogene Mas-like [Crotalus tigris]|uniref:proto-oncogene Mas-like n=1 Tax=Crotalus tigris TaxID=88082 RepID=UPI00192FA203|nr:proto-oncogene Mas-like [Crotalus tigris]